MWRVWWRDSKRPHMSCASAIARKENLTMADNRGSTAAVLLAFLGGAALGAVAAVLLAPESGAESRERVRKYARRAEGELQNLAGRAGEVFEEVVGQGKEFVDAKKSAFQEAFEAGREAMRQERDRLRNGGSNGA
uniref:YtxH domain-containing protein n=1 Tax=Nitrospira cf. moscoviensis SBR1015 TaxID=96242 RepID=UPI000B3BC2A2|nr:YtxH domain-containing protein [Nitrospira cf. moscoviensis SBR1015]